MFNNQNKAVLCVKWDWLFSCVQLVIKMCYCDCVRENWRELSNDVSLLETRDIYEDSAFSNNIPHTVNGSRVKINLIHTSVRPRPRLIVAFCSFVSKHATFSKGILSTVQSRSGMKTVNNVWLGIEFLRHSCCWTFLIRCIKVHWVIERYVYISNEQYRVTGRETTIAIKSNVAVLKTSQLLVKSRND